MIYLLLAIVLGAALTGWMWRAATHAPLMDDRERTCPPTSLRSGDLTRRRDVATRRP